MRETSTAPLLAWSRVFPAVPAQVREARQFLSGILDGRPATERNPVPVRTRHERHRSQPIPRA